MTWSHTETEKHWRFGKPSSAHLGLPGFTTWLLFTSNFPSRVFCIEKRVRTDRVQPSMALLIQNVNTDSSAGMWFYTVRIRESCAKTHIPFARPELKSIMKCKSTIPSSTVTDPMSLVDCIFLYASLWSPRAPCRLCLSACAKRVYSSLFTRGHWLGRHTRNFCPVQKHKTNTKQTW